MNRIPFLLFILLAACAQKQDEAPKPKQDDKKQQAKGWYQPVQLCTLRSEQIAESSGVAPSWDRPNIYYTHNDSGDKPRFFRFNAKGEILATFDLTGAKALDWEDMAAAKIKGKSYLYFGDIGDNGKVRKNITIYRLREPDPNAVSGGVTGFETYTVTYPDGAHNAEALMVHPGNGNLYIVTKTSEDESQVFKLAAPKGSGSYTMAEVGRIKLPGGIPGFQLVTSGDISPDAKRIIIRTYFGAFEYTWETKFDDWINSKATQITTAQETQGEAICYTTDGKAVITTSEGMPCPVHMIRKT